MGQYTRGAPAGIAARTPKLRQRLLDLLKKKGLWGTALKGAVGVGALLSAREIYDLVTEHAMGGRQKDIEAVEGTTRTTADFLREIRAQELGIQRQARLLRKDPEAHNMLAKLMAGNQLRQEPLATGEFTVGGPALSQEPTASEIQALLGAL
jgi:hypothetical protein